MQEKTHDRVYAFICQYVDENQIPPTLQDIADGIQRSRPTVHRALDLLEARGKVTRERHKMRTILPVR